MKLDVGQSNVRLVIKGSNLTIDGSGVTLVGPGQAGKPETFQGIAIRADGCSNVTLRNVKAKGFAIGLAAQNGTDWRIENCDFSDNFHDPEHDWGNGPRQGGIILTRLSRSILRNNKANRVWNGLDLDN